ncbi:MAG: glycoside hydrolase family 3 C-terminal domain-containing protein, partial [Clostridia bacterium]|nr:glycoside hydrolase family 3 C-terminal domain-containing protein [Clostridia bacterium]
VGYGSGGDIKYPYSINLIEGLKTANVNLNQKVLDTYQKWTKKSSNIPDQGYWGHWPMNYKEMPVSDKLVFEASKTSQKAIVVIGRAAGEDRENLLKKGSYYLTDKEKDLLKKVTRYFLQTIVILDCGNIIDMSWVDDYNIDGILYAWQGGMESGNALADILTGKKSPSGKLPATISKKYEDYPSSKCFGNAEYNNYIEDIYVGYRYFETFAKDKVLYPFGYGMSYSKFNYENSMCHEDTKISLKINVLNCGEFSSKEVVQVYLALPQEVLGNPSKILVAFRKTTELKPTQNEFMEIDFDLKDFASFDELGLTGYESAYVLEKGEYKIYVGCDSRNNKEVGKVVLDETICVSKVDHVMSLDSEKVFLRVKNQNNTTFLNLCPTAKVDLKKRILDNLPKTIEPKEYDNISTLKDVKEGKLTLEEFVSMLTIEELDAIVSGEGKMNSALGVEGNAGAFGGVSESLRKKGVLPIITTDGPSGIRLFKTCALLPCGTAISSTFNTPLIESLYKCIADEMKIYGSDVLLAPGMNIHRNPLCGRNFEYFSEDPYLSGMIASAVVNGLQKNGVSACPKHFACNNQEVNRLYNDSRVSERALREIYLKNFEIAVRNSKPNVIMTSYNKVNGIWSHYNYDLVTTVLRKEWGYDGLIITDWGMREDVSREFPNVANNAYRMRSQVDVLMPGRLELKKDVGLGNTIQKSLELEEGITLGEVQRSAINVLNYILKTKY